MRSLALLAILVTALALAAAGCGGDDDEAGSETTTVTTTETTETSQTTETTTTETTGETGDAAAGEEVFASAGCGSCHTLAAAGSTGSVGPNLDDASPSYDKVVERVTEGQGVMPSFADQLTPQQIQDVAAYVSGSVDG
jgi:mono/diheme cytochrome c family protein